MVKLLALAGTTLALLCAWAVPAAIPPASGKGEVETCRELAVDLSRQRGEKFVTEHRLWDGTRVDLLSDTWAVEVDYAGKWAECIGQALYYGQVSGRKPVCLLLVNLPADGHFVYRCQTVCHNHGIELWVVERK